MKFWMFLNETYKASCEKEFRDTKIDLNRRSKPLSRVHFTDSRNSTFQGASVAKSFLASKSVMWPLIQCLLCRKSVFAFNVYNKVYSKRKCFWLWTCSRFHQFKQEKFVRKSLLVIVIATCFFCDERTWRRPLSPKLLQKPRSREPRLRLQGSTEELFGSLRCPDPAFRSRTPRPCKSPDGFLFRSASDEAP